MSESKWLIKSNGLIIGPFSEEQIKYKLSEKGLVPIDEGCLPFGRWRFLRDIASFARVLEEIRLSEQGTSEHTYTYTQSVHSDNFSITAPLNNEYVVEVEDEIVSKQFQKNKAQQSSNAYAHESDSVINESVKKSTSRYWLLLIVIVLALLLTYLLNFYFINPKKIKNDELKSLSNAEYFFNNNAMVYSLNELKKMTHTQINSEKYKYLKGPLLLKVDRETSSSMGMILNSKAFKDFELSNFQGNASLINKKYIEAINFYNQSIDENPDFLPAYFNRGIAEYYSRNYSKSSSDFQELISRGGRDAFAYLHYVKSLLRLNNYSLPDEVFLTIQNYLSKAESERGGYPQEVAFYKLFVKIINNATSDSVYKSEIINLLNFDPELSKKLTSDIYTAPHLLSWSHILKDCEYLVNKRNSDSLSELLLSFCLIKSNQLEKSNKILQKLISQDPKNQLNQIMFAYLQLVQGLNVEASVALGRVINNLKIDNFFLPFLLQAKLCLREQDINCAKEYFYKIINQKGFEVTALIELSDISLKENNKTESLRLLNKAKKITQNYAPIYKMELALRDKK